MKDFQKKLAVTAALSVMLLTLFSSCKNDPDNNSTTTEPYSYNSVQSTTGSSSAASEDPEKPFAVNTSWQKNYRVTYEYYNSADGTNTVTVKETKNKTAFTAEYPDGDSLLYYKENGSDTDYYVIMTGKEKKAVHTLLENKSFSELNSTFMKLTKVSSNLPSLSNVLYMYDENIGGRACRKYLQRAYSSGKLTESVYIWIDIEFGFAAKCESYNADNKMTVMWSVKEFEAGAVPEDGIKPDLSQYTVTEEEKP